MQKFTTNVLPIELSTWKFVEADICVLNFEQLDAN